MDDIPEMAPEDMLDEIRKLRTELRGADEKVREAREAQMRAEGAMDPLRQRVLDLEAKRGFEQAQVRHMSRVEQRRAQLMAELAQLDEQTMQ